jgi:polyhydroxyalkanoate synthase
VEACLDALDVTCEIAGSDDANVMGMCAGAITMACMLGHLQATERAERVHATTYIVAGLDNGVETQIGHLASSRSIEAARTRSHRNGVLDGADLAQVFAWLRPNDLVWNYWVNNYLKGQNPPAFDVLHWNADTTRLPAALHGDFLDLQASNALAVGGLEVLETPVDLEKVGQDAYIVAGSTDHIVPWHQAFQTTQLLGGSGTFVLSTSGHIQAVVNPPGRGRASFRTAPDSHTSASDWWEASTVNEGTWWPHWAKWLKDRSGTRRKAPPTAGSAAHPAVDEAPGRYVHLR